MFSRFTEKAIQSIMLAQEEAKRFQHGYVGTEHLLLGIMGEGDNVVIKVLQELGFQPDSIKTEIEGRLEYGSSTADNSNIPFTQQAKQVLSNAWDEARKLGHNYVNVEHLFLSIFQDMSNVAAMVLTEKGLNAAKFKEALFNILGDRVEAPSQKPVNTVPTPTLDLFGRDLTWLGQDKKLDPVIGREQEIERIVQILCRRTKNNPVLTGEPGVGKTAVVEGLAQRIIGHIVPEKLQDKRVISLDLGLLVAGTKYRGEFEDRVKKIMEEVRKAGNVILFIDELHTIIGTGGSEGSLDAANLFKPALARGELQCIGATTLDEYRKHIEGDGALERRFQSVMIEEPSQSETYEILLGIRSRYEEYHDVTITDAALSDAVQMSTRYITDRHLPDKAVDVIDEAASKVMLAASRLPKEVKSVLKEKEQILDEIKTAKEKDDQTLQNVLAAKMAQVETQISGFSDAETRASQKVVDEVVIAEVVSAWTGVPLSSISEEESKKLVKLNKVLGQKIVGQGDAIDAVTRAIKRSKIGLKDPDRPTGSFLFLGPTGVGKSELAKIMAEYLFGSEDALIRLDMSEYMEKHTVSRLIGSPPGYVGYNEGGQLTEPVRRKPYSIVLFDELEKASPDVINILLQILEDGRLTDSNGRTVNFKNTIIVMTSNVGAKFIQKETSFGFSAPGKEEDVNFDKMKEKLHSELHNEFKPEFLNRIDDIVIFRSLVKKHVRVIVDIMIKELASRLEDKNIKVKATDKVKEFLLENGFNEKQGARPLRRAIQQHFEDPLADIMIRRGLRDNVSVSATLKKDKISFVIRKIKKRKVTLSAQKDVKALRTPSGRGSGGGTAKRKPSRPVLVSG